MAGLEVLRTLSDDELFLTVNNTFFEMKVLEGRSARTHSEPLGFKPDEVSSQASTEVSEDDDTPDAHGSRFVRSRLQLPPAALLHVEGEEDDEGDLWSPAGGRKITYVPTPSTCGRRTPDGFLAMPARQIAFGDASSRGLGCLPRPTWTSHSPPDYSPAVPKRRVSFAAFDEVLHFHPAPPSSPSLPPPPPPPPPSAAPPSPAEILQLTATAAPGAAARALRGNVANATCASLSSKPAAWAPSAEAPVFVPSCQRGQGSAAAVPVAAPEPWERLRQVVESVRNALAATGSGVVACAEAKQGARGWTVTAHVQPHALDACRDHLLASAQQALFAASETSGSVVLLGHAANPFTWMPQGFGAAIADVPDRASACPASLSMGFCDNPGSCGMQHPVVQTGVEVMLKPAMCVPR